MMLVPAGWEYAAGQVAPEVAEVQHKREIGRFRQALPDDEVAAGTMRGQHDIVADLPQDSAPGPLREPSPQHLPVGDQEHARGPARRVAGGATQPAVRIH